MKFYKYDAFTKAAQQVKAAREALQKTLEENSLMEHNFVIGAYWPKSGGICTYTFHGKDVHFGDMESAKKLLQEVKDKISNSERSNSQPKKNDYQIFQLVPVKN